LHRRQWRRKRLLSVWCKSKRHSCCVPRYFSTYVANNLKQPPLIQSFIGGLKIAGEDDAYDFGSGAGFYVNAAKEPWLKNYKMETYITSELPSVLFSSFQELDSSRVSITGHSMGGHGALSLFLKNPGMYKSVSAFAPIANPVKCPWGEKAFTGYLGDDRTEWKKHDATELVKNWKDGKLDVLIDVGTGDNFYKQKQLLPENFAEAAKESGNDKGLVIRYQDVSFRAQLSKRSTNAG
jgi:S-formylglutathione hydrolase